MIPFQASLSPKEASLLLTLPSPTPSLIQVESKVEDAKRGFFSGEWTFLSESFASHKLVGGLIIACALIAAPDYINDPGAMGTSRALHVNALGAVRAAMLDAKEIREDATLVASMLLASFEVSHRICKTIVHALTKGNSGIAGVIYILRVSGRSMHKALAAL